MARIFIDGFESGDKNLWEGGGAGPQINSGSIAGGSGNYYCYLPDGQGISKILPKKSVYYVGFRVEGSLDIRFMEWLTSVSYLQGFVTLNFSGQEVAVHTGTPPDGGYDTVYSFNPIINHGWTFGTPYHIQVRFENVSATEKRVQVKLNGQEVIDATITNTSSSALTTNYIEISENIIGLGARIDDVVIDDADWPGESEIFGLTPVADGSASEWTPMSGESHYEMVDTVPIPTYGSAAEWIQSVTPSAVDLFEMSDVPLGDQLVKSVQLHVYGKMDSISGETFKCAIRTSGETHYSHSGEYSANFTNTISIWDSNPATSGEWTMAEAQNIEAGVALI